MSHEEGFLQGIIDEPDDDGLRLIYADWLEDRGDPRGDFIRVQIELANLTEDDPRRFDLEQREEALLAAHEKEWLGELEGQVCQWRFRRGFVEWVWMRAGFAAHAEEVFRWTPLRSANLFGLRDAVAEVAACPVLGRLHGLDLSRDDKSEADVEIVLASPYLERLSELDLSGHILSTGAVARLAEMPGLSVLRLSGCDLGLPAVETLSHARRLSGLTELRLNDNRLSDVSLQVLAEAPHWKRLRVLGLSHTHAGPAGIRALASSRQLRNLADVDLSGNRFGGFIEALARPAPWVGLRRLNLSGCFIGRTGAQELAASASLAFLEALDLTGNEIGDEGARALAGSPHLGRVQELALGANGLRLAGAKALATAPPGTAAPPRPRRQSVGRHGSASVGPLAPPGQPAHAARTQQPHWRGWRQGFWRPFAT